MRDVEEKGRMSEDLDDAQKVGFRPPNQAVGAYGNVIQDPFTNGETFKPETSSPPVEDPMQRAMMFLYC